MVMLFPEAVPGGVVGVLTHTIIERVLELLGFELTPTGRGEYRGGTGEALPAAGAGDRPVMVGRTIVAMLVAHARVFVAGRTSSLVPAHPWRSVLVHVR